MRSFTSPAIRAALLSGLLFPGLGHFALRRPLRGCLFLLPTLLALVFLLRQMLQLAEQLLTELNTGQLTLDPLLIMERVHASGIDNPLSNGAALLCLLCWLGAVADALWLGRAR
ncbi:MAG: DUF6677 family protein [Sphingomonadaceae bacterium]